MCVNAVKITDVRLVALFSMPIGLCTSSLLNSLAIAFRFPLSTSKVSLLLCLLLIVGAFFSTGKSIRTSIKRLFASVAFPVTLTFILRILQQPLLTWDSYQFILAGRALEAGRLESNSSLLSDYPLSMVHLQAISFGLGGEFVAYVAPVAGIMLIIGSTVVAAENFTDNPQLLHGVVSGVWLVGLVSAPVLQFQLSYVNSHLFFAGVVCGSFFLLSDRKVAPRQLHILASLFLATVAVTRVEGLLVFVLITTATLSDRVRLTRRDCVLLVSSSAVPFVWYLSLLLAGASGEILTPARLSFLLAFIIIFDIVLIGATRFGIGGLLGHAVLFFGPFLILALAVNSDSSWASARSFIYNVALYGQWGLVWPSIFCVLLVIVLLRIRFSGSLPLMVVTIGYLYLIILLGLIRQPPYRIGWGDSGNRMLVHVFPSAVVLVSMSFLGFGKDGQKNAGKVN